MFQKLQQSGRSMIEMLGVLAIIGVLSVGGIAGYTMAMNKYRANEVLNTASMLFWPELMKEMALMEKKIARISAWKKSLSPMVYPLLLYMTKIKIR